MTTPADPREVRTAVVLKQGERAGTLRREDDEIWFRYDDEYLDGNGPAVATTLPLTDQPRVRVLRRRRRDLGG